MYRRPPSDVTRYQQELLLDEEDYKITLALRDAPGPEPAGGAALLWFTFPGRAHEVAAVYETNGRLRGHYTNIVSPPEFRSATVWHIDDRCLDVWQPRGEPAELLDEDELRESETEGWIEPAAAADARREARWIMDRIESRRWPPRVVRRWPLDSVPSLRFRRDEPGRYAANLVSIRIIAYGLYMMGTVSLTSILFAAFSDALIAPGPAQRAWLVTLAAEGVLLLPFALAGRLPATEHARPGEAMNERTLLAAAAAAGIAVVLLNRSELWRDLLVAVYGSLALFLTVFGLSRAWLDRVFPLAAIAGLALCVIALVVLL